MSETRCRHELIEEQCDYCTPRAAPEPEPDGIDWGTVVRRAARPASRAFVASYDSDCGECGGRIFEGDLIRMLEGEAIHDECHDDVSKCPLCVQARGTDCVDPRDVDGPIGMFHCPGCGVTQLAGFPHVNCDRCDGEG